MFQSIANLSGLAILFVALFGSDHQVSAIKKIEIPFANLTLEGGPENGYIDVTDSFSLDCLYTAKYDSKLWFPVVTFYLNDKVLGNFNLVKKTDNTMAVNWNNQELIPNVNVFSNTDLAHASHSTYSIWVQAMSENAAKGLYTCSITLEDSTKSSRARYFSNALYFE